MKLERCSRLRHRLTDLDYGQVLEHSIEAIEKWITWLHYVRVLWSMDGQELMIQYSIDRTD